MKKSIVLSLLLLLSSGRVGCVFYPVTNYYIYKVVPADDAASGPSLYEGSIRKWAATVAASLSKTPMPR